MKRKRPLNPKNIFLSLVCALLPLAVSALPEQTSQVLKMTGSKRLEASICKDAMNRLAVANDRITQIFGDEGTFESQNDDTTGQVFLKPTFENGAKNLSLTLITEQGITQDLMLKPDAKSARTLILSRNFPSRDPWSSEQPPEPFKNFSKVLPIEESRLGESRLDQILTVLKQAISGRLPIDEEAYEASSRQTLSKGCVLTPHQSWQAGPYVVRSFSVEAKSPASAECQERMFYQPGDLALSLDARSDGTTMLYVVSYRKGDLP